MTENADDAAKSEGVAKLREAVVAGEPEARVLLGERAHVTIAECDVSVARVYPFAGRIENVVGRGGPDLRPVFAPSLLGAHDVDGVVYFTDGDGPYSKEPPPVPTLWVLTKPQAFRCPWGERARLREPR